MAGGVDEGAITFGPCATLVDEWVTVSEPEIARAMLSALERHGERFEGSAGVAVAAFEKLRDIGQLAGQTCVMCCCGGNVSDDTLEKARMLTKHMTSCEP